MNTAPAALTVEGLTFDYPARPGVLAGLDLVIRPGERVGIIGSNGAGKTTLFLLLCGVLKPAAGSIRLFDRPVTPGQFHPEIGLVFQNPDDQLFCPSVWDDVAFGPQNLGLVPEEVVERVRRALAQTATSHLADRSPQRLSGGEKRMVAIAGVLAMQPRLVIYDEPGAYLDLRARRRLIGFLQQTSEAFLLAAHDLALIGETCERVLILDAGRIVADGPTQAVLGDQAIVDQYGLE
jgi:cobalt/nickel transport system ATP-binding protein